MTEDQKLNEAIEHLKELMPQTEDFTPMIHTTNHMTIPNGNFRAFVDVASCADFSRAELGMQKDRTDTQNLVIARLRNALHDVIDHCDKQLDAIRVVTLDANF